MSNSDLNPVHQRFADGYIKTGKKQKSMLQADPTLKPEVASVKANRLLKNDKVRAYIKSKAKLASENIVDLACNAVNENVKLSANKDILDRAGYKPMEHKSDAVTVEDPTQARKQLDTLLSAIQSGNEIELQRMILKPKV